MEGRRLSAKRAAGDAQPCNAAVAAVVVGRAPADGWVSMSSQPVGPRPGMQRGSWTSGPAANTPRSPFSPISARAANRPGAGA